MYKQSNILSSVGEFFTQNAPQIAATTILGIVAPAVGKYYLHKSIDALSKDKDFRVKNTNEIIDKAKVMAGMSDVPHRQFRGLDNAFYVMPNAISDDRVHVWKQKAEKNLLSPNKKEQEFGKMLNTILDYNKKKTGGIVVGENFVNPHVVAHELGHAKIERDGGFGAFAQKYSSTVKNLGLLVGLGSIVPRAFGYGDIGNAMSLAGLGGIALGASGEVYNEYQASNIAKKMLEKVKFDPAAKEKGEKMLNLALGTYIAGGLQNVGAGYLGNVGPKSIGDIFSSI